MGISWSNRRNSSYLHGFPPVPPHLLQSPYVYASETQPLPPASHLMPPLHNYVHALPVPYPPPHLCVPHSCYPSYPPPSVGYATYPPACTSSSTLVVRPIGPLHNQSTGWAAIQPAALPFQAPPPLVEHENAKKVRSDINVHKDTLRLEIDECNPDNHLVSFVFDALADGSFTISYFAKEELSCKFIQQFPEASTPIKLPFQKGLGQKFSQPSGTGIDLGFFVLDDLAKPSPEDEYPLVISAEMHTSEHESSSGPGISPSHIQVTQAVIEKNGDYFNPRVAKQILWADGIRYELREIYGVGSSSLDNDPGKACVVCMTEPKDTALLPCRHMCLCKVCAKELRLRSNKCPVCRHPIEELLEIFS